MICACNLSRGYWRKQIIRIDTILSSRFSAFNVILFRQITRCISILNACMFFSFLCNLGIILIYPPWKFWCGIIYWYVLSVTKENDKIDVSRILETKEHLAKVPSAVKIGNPVSPAVAKRFILNSRTVIIFEFTWYSCSTRGVTSGMIQNKCSPSPGL